MNSHSLNRFPNPSSLYLQLSYLPLRTITDEFKQGLETILDSCDISFRKSVLTEHKGHSGLYFMTVRIRNSKRFKVQDRYDLSDLFQDHNLNETLGPFAMRTYLQGYEPIHIGYIVGYSPVDTYSSFREQQSILRKFLLLTSTTANASNLALDVTLSKPREYLQDLSYPKLFTVLTGAGNMDIIDLDLDVAFRDGPVTLDGCPVSLETSYVDAVRKSRDSNTLPRSVSNRFAKYSSKFVYAISVRVPVSQPITTTVDEVRSVFSGYSPLSVTPNHRNDGKLTSCTVILPKGCTNLSSLLRRRQAKHSKRLVFSNGKPVIFKKTKLPRNPADMHYSESEVELELEEDEEETRGDYGCNLDLVMDGFFSRVGQ
jgi:hypothetical protein